MVAGSGPGPAPAGRQSKPLISSEQLECPMGRFLSITVAARRPEDQDGDEGPGEQHEGFIRRGQ